MFQRIMVPVDLNHTDTLGKALRVAADLARHYGATACYVGVTASTPSRIAHNPKEYEHELESFAQAQAAAYGHKAVSHAMVSHDPAVDLEATLELAIDETNRDLVVMASHLPGLRDRLWPSNGGALAGHARSSVLVVRAD
jgi:nucleotide-binding universal stress UspA family protein